MTSRLALMTFKIAPSVVCWKLRIFHVYSEHFTYICQFWYFHFYEHPVFGSLWNKTLNRLLNLFEIFLTISKNCQPNVLSTRVSKTECYKHTFSENFGLCFKFVLISSLFFTKLSGVQSTNDGGLLGRAIVALRTTSNEVWQKCQSEMRQKSRFNLLRLNFNSFNFMTFMTFKS